MNPANVPILDIELFAGISFPMSFELVRCDADGNETGPYDLDGKQIAAVFRRAIHSDTLTLVSGEGANAAGSICEITNVSTGAFRFNLSATELADPHATDGDWRLEARWDDEAEILVRGHLRFIPFTAGGEV